MAAGDGAAEAPGPGPGPGPGQGPVSFSFSRRAERRRPLPAGPCAEPGAGGDTESDTDFLTAVEGRELLSTRPAPPPKQELVIPLIPARRRWNPGTTGTTGTGTDPAPGTGTGTAHGTDPTHGTGTAPGTGTGTAHGTDPAHGTGTAHGTDPAPSTGPAPSAEPAHRPSPAPRTSPAPISDPAPCTGPAPSSDPAHGSSPAPIRSPAHSADPTHGISPAPSAGPAPSSDPARGPSPAPSAAPPSVEAQAVQELLQEARQSQEPPPGHPGPIMAIPLPGQRDRDVGTGPQPTPQDYEAVPVGQFGLAMLRGMGWSQGQGIGRTFARVVPPLEQRPRPRGLGLGAEAAPPGAGEPPQAGPGVGDAVSIEAGPHRGLRGQVQALLPEAGRALVRLLLGGQVVTVSQHGLRALSDGAPGRPSPPGSGGGAQGEDPPRGGGKRREPPPEQRSAKQPRGAPPAPPPHWLRRDLRVRCVDTAFRGGVFYNCKMTIEDLLAPDICVCRTDDGRLVEGLREASLETVVPRGSSERVMVVLGEHAGQLGRILERDGRRGRALVQLSRAGAAVLPLPFDCICHYLGGDED